MVRLTAREKRNIIIRMGVVLILMGIFVYLITADNAGYRQKIIDRDIETVTLMAQSFGYEGEKDIRLAIDYLDQVNRNNLNDEHINIIERARGMQEQSEFEARHKAPLILFVFLAVPYLFFEYFFNGWVF